LNTEEEFRFALDMNINGIITDYPSNLIDFMESNPDYKAKYIRLNNKNK